MPGIYVSDNGETASALGKILGGIANNYNPQTIAEAQNLRYRTEGQDISNQQAYEILRARQAAEAATPGFLDTFNANPQPPGASVANTITGLAQPPQPTGVTPIGNRSAVDTSVFSPFAKVTAARIAQGDFSPAEQAGTIDLGQSATVGPGNTYGAIKTRSTTPLGPGQVIDTTGQPGGPTLTGGDEYGATVARTTGQSNPAAAENDIREGAAADANFGKAQQALAIYDQYVAPNADPAGVLSEEAVRKLSAATGVNFTRLTNADAKAQIKQFFLGMVGSMRDTQGNPLPRGAVEYIVSQFPDPDADPVRFHSMVNALLTSLDQQRKDGQAALDYYRAPTPDAYVRYLQQKGVNAGAVRDAFTHAGLDIRQGQEEPKPGPTESKLQPADPGTVARARVKLRQANNDPAFRKQLIDAGRANGVDLEAGGF